MSSADRDLAAMALGDARRRIIEAATAYDDIARRLDARIADIDTILGDGQAMATSPAAGSLLRDAAATADLIDRTLMSIRAISDEATGHLKQAGAALKVAREAIGRMDEGGGRDTTSSQMARTQILSDAVTSVLEDAETVTAHVARARDRIAPLVYTRLLVDDPTVQGEWVQTVGHETRAGLRHTRDAMRVLDDRLRRLEPISTTAAREAVTGPQPAPTPKPQPGL